SDTEMMAREMGRRCSTMMLRRYLPHVAQSPAHTRGAVSLTVNHDLRGAPRTVLTRQIDAFLNDHDVFMGIEVPNIPVRQQQHGAVSVGEAGGAGARMKVEANRKLILCIRRQGVSSGREENVFAIEPVAVPRQGHEALMKDTE